MLLADATFEGRVDARDAWFDGGLARGGATFGGELAVGGVTVGTFLDLHAAPPAGLTGTFAVADDTRVDGEPAPWIAGR